MTVTFLTMMAAAINLGADLPQTLSLYLEDSISWQICGVAGLIYSGLYITLLGKRILGLNSQEKMGNFCYSSSKLFDIVI